MDNVEKVNKLEEISYEIVAETVRATTKFGPFTSAHEGYAVLLEEVDELWQEIKKNSRDRSLEKMREEAVQVGAMAARFILDVCDSGRGAVQS